MNHANSTPLVDTWSHYLATLGAVDLFNVIMAFLLTLATGCFLTMLWFSVSVVDRDEPGASGGLGGSDSTDWNEFDDCDQSDQPEQ